MRFENFQHPQGDKEEKLERERENLNEAKNSQLETEKLKKLQEARQDIDSWGDRLGEGVDEGIKDTVAVFNVMNIPTSASCEGHFENASQHGYPVPWVEVEAPDKPEWRFQGEKEVYKQVAEKHKITIDEVLHADNEEAWKEAVRLSAQREETNEYKAWEKENDKLLEKVDDLLQEFYRERESSDEARIITDRGVGGFRVHNGGKFYIPNNQRERIQSELTKEEQKRIPEILKMTQQEMKDFTEFLKKKYMETS